MNKQEEAQDVKLQGMAMNNSLPDGRYLTTTKSFYCEREVVIKGGILSLVGDNVFGFKQANFFDVNFVIKPLPCDF